MTEEVKTPISKFRTSDIVLVALLKYNQYIVKGIDKISHNKVEFLFENVSRELLTEYNQDHLMVEPRLFASIMKQQTHSAKMALKTY